MALRGIEALALKDDALLIGLRLAAGATCKIDVDDSQLALVQEAIDRGDVQVNGMEAKPKAAPVDAKKPAADRVDDPSPKGKGK